MVSASEKCKKSAFSISESCLGTTFRWPGDAEPEDTDKGQPPSCRLPGQARTHIASTGAEPPVLYQFSKRASIFLDLGDMNNVQQPQPCTNMRSGKKSK